MFIIPKNVEDLIISKLRSGPTETGELIVYIQTVRPGITKQAIYKSLRILRKEEVVVQTERDIMLSDVWLAKLSDFFESVKLGYGTKNPSLDFLQLKQGERISYMFRSFEATDIFWGHAFSILSNFVSLESVFIYNPHEWFLLARPESEVFLFNNLTKNNRKLCVVSGGATELDKSVTKYFKGPSERYIISPDFFKKPNYYVNLFGDFVIEVWLDKEVSTAIDKFYLETKVFDEVAKSRLLEIIRTRGRSRLVIAKNARKSAKIKRMFVKKFGIL